MIQGNGKTGIKNDTCTGSGQEHKIQTVVSKVIQCTGIKSDTEL